MNSDTRATSAFPMLDLMMSWQENYVRAVGDLAGAFRIPAATSWPSASRAMVPTGSRSALVGSVTTHVPNGEHVIALGEETFNVEKKIVEGAKTTVRRVVVETPVSTDVKLVAKTVTVERRKPVDITNHGKILSEETLVVTDTTEVPVVVKGVRLVEEVIVRQEETVSVQTVRDTIRRDDVQIDRPRQNLVPVKKSDGAKEHSKATAEQK